MIEPSIKVGFIIFNDDWKSEVEWHNGHSRTAREWVREHNLRDYFEKVKEANNLYDEEQFITDYIGAIKLYAYGGNFYCYAPKIVSVNKDYLCEYYQNLGYTIIGNMSYNEEKKNKVKQFSIPYNKTIVKSNNGFIYNPYRDGD